MNILAIDQGTSATKALVISPDRGVIASAEAEVRPRYGPGGSVEQDPAELLDSVINAGRQAVRIAGETIGAIGIANQGETVLAWDRGTGKPLTPALGWQDRRAQTTCDELGQDLEVLKARTGLTLDAYFAAPKMRWLRDNLTRDGVVTTVDAWVTHGLTGAFVTDAATASRTMLLDLASTEWSDEALSLLGLDGEELPTIVDCAGTIGETSAFTGSPVPVTGLIVDQPAALFGQGCLEVNDAKCTFGTGAFFLANLGTDTPDTSASALTTSVAWRLDGKTTYCADGQVFTAASAVRWLVDLGLLRAAADLDAVGATVADSAGVMCVPALAGLGAPWSRTDARASLTGLGLDTGAGHIVRAVVEGIAQQVAALVEASGLSLSSLQVDGGLTRSTLLMQAQADALGIPVHVSAIPDATAWGMAAIAARGAQSEAPTRSSESPTVFTRQISADEAGARRDRFHNAVRTMTA